LVVFGVRPKCIYRTPRSVVSPKNDASFRPQRSDVQFKTESSSHLIRQLYPYSTKQKYTKAIGIKLTNGSTTKDTIKEVSNVTSSGNVADNKIKDTKKLFTFGLW